MYYYYYSIRHVGFYSYCVHNAYTIRCNRSKRLADKLHCSSSTTTFHCILPVCIPLLITCYRKLKIIYICLACRFIYTMCGPFKSMLIFTGFTVFLELSKFVDCTFDPPFSGRLFYLSLLFIDVTIFIKLFTVS